jgi:dGTPase
MNVREKLERQEEETLHPRAAHSSRSRGRKVREPDCDLRTIYQRDRDRILHSKAFRRLKHKTQVFLAPRGDHYRTRLTHTLEVAQIARTISRALGLNNELTEAVALGHDLGHTPFGHAGEAALNGLVSGGFSHVEQSIRVVETLEKDGRGLNLSMEVIDGIRMHSKGTGEIIPAPGERAETLEGQIVRLADIVAYINHDIDDAVRAGIIESADLPTDRIAKVGRSHSERIGTMARDIVTTTTALDLEYAAMSVEIIDHCRALRDFLFREVYYNTETQKDFKKASRLLRELYDYYRQSPEEMGGETLGIASEGERERLVVDFIAGMTDRFATATYERLFLPQPWKVL